MACCGAAKGAPPSGKRSRSAASALRLPSKYPRITQRSPGNLKSWADTYARRDTPASAAAPMISTLAAPFTRSMSSYDAEMRPMQETTPRQLASRWR